MEVILYSVPLTTMKNSSVQSVCEGLPARQLLVSVAPLPDMDPTIWPKHRFSQTQSELKAKHLPNNSLLLSSSSPLCVALQVLKAPHHSDCPLPPTSAPALPRTRELASVNVSEP